MKAKETYVCKSTLRDTYGMTPKMILAIGEPDKTKPNPHYRSVGYPMCLYRLGRVELWVEENKEWIENHRAKRKELSEAQKAIYQRRIAPLLGWANTVNIKITPLDSYDKLVDEASNFYCNFNEEYREVGPTGVIAYVRHNKTNYDFLLESLKQYKYGRNEAYFILKDRVDGRVSDVLGLN